MGKAFFCSTGKETSNKILRNIRGVSGKNKIN